MSLFHTAHGVSDGGRGAWRVWTSAPTKTREPAGANRPERYPLNCYLQSMRRLQHFRHSWRYFKAGTVLQAAAATRTVRSQKLSSIYRNLIVNMKRFHSEKSFSCSNGPKTSLRLQLGAGSEAADPPSSCCFSGRGLRITHYLFLRPEPRAQTQTSGLQLPTPAWI